MNNLKCNIYILLCCLFLFISCKNKYSPSFIENKNQVQLNGSIQSTEIRFIYPPKNTRSSTIKNIIDEGSLVKKGDFIAEFTPQKDNTDLLDKKQKIDQILQDKSNKIQDINNQIQKNMVEINKNASDIEVFNKTRSKKSIDDLSQFIPLNNLKKEIIDNKISLVSMDDLKKQNNILEEKISLYKNNYDKRMNLIQKYLSLDAKNEKFIATTDSDGILFSLKNWRNEKFIKGSNVYESEPIARIENTKNMQVVSYLPEEDRNLAKIGQKVKITIFSTQNIELEGTIKSISKIVMPLENWDIAMTSGKPSDIDPLYFQLAVTLNAIPNSLKPATKVQVQL